MHIIFLPTSVLNFYWEIGHLGWRTHQECREEYLYMHVSGNMVWAPKCTRMWQADWRGESTDLNWGVAMTTSARRVDVMKIEWLLTWRRRGLTILYTTSKGNKQSRVAKHHAKQASSDFANWPSCTVRNKSWPWDTPAWFGLRQHCTITNRNRYACSGLNNIPSNHM